MIYRRLGRTDIEVSCIGLGGHLFPAEPIHYYPGFYGRKIKETKDLSTRLAVVGAALEAGINLVAADFDYEAEELGRVLRELNARNKVVITAVLDFRLEPEKRVRWPELEEKIDRLLVLLGTDTLDLPQIRVGDGLLGTTMLPDLLDHLEKLSSRGKIRYPAFYSSDHDLEILITGLDQGWFPVVCRAFGFLNPTPADRLLPTVVKNKAGFIGFVPFQKGWLFDCGKEAGLPAKETATSGLNWAVSHPGVTSILFGVSGAGEVANNAAALPARDSTIHNDTLLPLTKTQVYRRYLEEIRHGAPHLAPSWTPERQDHAVLP